MKLSFVPGEGMKLVEPAPLAAYLRAQLSIARKELHDHAHKYSPRKFTQPQLKTLLGLREHSAMMAQTAQRVTSGPFKDEFKDLQLEGKHLPNLGWISFRQLIQLLNCNPELADALELKRIPTYSTLAHAARRFPKQDCV